MRGIYCMCQTETLKSRFHLCEKISILLLLFNEVMKLTKGLKNTLQNEPGKKNFVSVETHDDTNAVRWRPCRNSFCDR